MQIPIIDISSLVNNKIDSKDLNKIDEKIISEIKHACQNIGFFLVKNHGIPDEIIDNIWQDTKDFFDSPFEYRNMFYSKNQKEYPYGYLGIGYENLNAGKEIIDNKKSTLLPDLKEMFSIGNNVKTKWPENPKKFKESWQNYFNSMENLSNKLLQVMALALDKDKDFFKKYVNNHASSLRALNYPNINNINIPKGQVRASPHTDYGTLTILNTDGPGLQVCQNFDYKSLNEIKWIDVPIIPNTLIINIGDIMQRWTNDIWKSTLHQVINIKGSSERRQSIAFFHNPNKDAIIESIIIDKKSKYEPIKVEDFLMIKHLNSIKK